VTEETFNLMGEVRTDSEDIEDHENSGGWWEEYKDIILVTVVATLAVNVLWEGIPEALLTITNVSANLYAGAVADAFFQTGSVGSSFAVLGSTAYFISIYCLLLVKLDDLERGEEGRYKKNALASVIFAILMWGFSAWAMTCNSAASEMRRGLSKVRVYVADSTYESLRFDVASIDTYKQLEEFRNRIDTLQRGDSQ
jgi:hypothetical protein